MDPRLARILEPRAPRPDLRIRTLGRLREAGIRGGVLCSPIMPGITDTRSSISAVARAAAGVKANFFAAGALFLKPCSQPTFFRFVREHFPDRLADYERRYGASPWVSPEYRQRVADLVNSICREYKLGKRYVDPLANEDEVPDPTKRIELQPWLPFTAKSELPPKAS